MLRITAPHFCCGWCDDGHCAPIISYMRHWSVAQVWEYCCNKGWEVEVV